MSADVMHHHYPVASTVAWLGLEMTFHQDSDLEHLHPHRRLNILEMMQSPLQLNWRQGRLMLLPLTEDLAVAARTQSHFSPL
jgi:hypothetical protein